MRSNQAAGDASVIVFIAVMVIVPLRDSSPQSVTELNVERTPELPYFERQVVEEGEVQEHRIEDDGLNLRLDHVQWGF